MEVPHVGPQPLDHSLAYIRCELAKVRLDVPAAASITRCLEVGGRREQGVSVAEVETAAPDVLVGVVAA
eukprot:scaffold149971_cov33-Prasinocladus_malaysianus.AAC.1